MFLPIGASLLSLGVCLPLFMYYKKSPRPVIAAMFKSLGTACALVVALVAAIRLDSRCFLFVAGISLHVIADYLLEFTFPLGVAFFAGGHLLYIAFFIKVFSLTIPAGICFAVLVFMLVLVFRQWRDKMKKQLPMFAFYGLILSALTAVAVGSGIPQASIGGTLAAVGGVLFFLSDFMLLQRILFPTGRIMPWAVMVSYYAAQLFLAISCLYL